MESGTALGAGSDGVETRVHNRRRRGGEASGRRGGRVGAGLLAVFEAVAVAVELEDVDVMGQPGEQRAGEAFGAEDLGLFVEGEIRGHER